MSETTLHLDTPTRPSPATAVGRPHPLDRPTPDATLAIKPWHDPLVDEVGHDPRSSYVETFWLGVLGPSATWLLRHLANRLDCDPGGFELDLPATATALGLTFSTSRSSPFTKALHRCEMFGLAHRLPNDALAVRRRIPPVAVRHLRRLPVEVQRAHRAWDRPATEGASFRRAHHLALTMIEVGDEPAAVERQLVALGVGPAVASQVADNISRL